MPFWEEAYLADLFVIFPEERCDIPALLFAEDAEAYLPERVPDDLREEMLFWTEAIPACLLFTFPEERCEKPLFPYAEGDEDIPPDLLELPDSIPVREFIADLPDIVVSDCLPALKLALSPVLKRPDSKPELLRPLPTLASLLIPSFLLWFILALSAPSLLISGWE